MPPKNKLRIVQLFKQVLSEVSPRHCVEKALQVKNNTLIVNGREYALNKNVRIIASGKAAVDMIFGAENALGPYIRDGIASVPIGSRIPPSLKTKFYEAAEYNLPDKLSIQNTEKIFDFLDLDIPNKSDAVVLFLISGGASALLCKPVDGVSLEDKLQVIRLLASNGADITELNTVRIVLSKIKGGQLAECIVPSKAISLIISDIVGGKIDKVGSGPTVQQEIDPLKAKQVLESRGVLDQIPQSVRSFLDFSTKHNECNDVDIQNVLICDNRVLLNCFKQLLESNGIETTIIDAELEGNASEVGEQFADPLLHWIQGNSLTEAPFNSQKVSITTAQSTRFAWLYGGETTVKFPPNLSNPNPKGGRNQEMVLSAFNKLHKELKLTQKQSTRHFYFASLGSDGQDGPTDATGALISSDDLDSKESIVHKIDEYLTNKDSYSFWSNFKKGERLVKIGKTGQNLMDIQLLVFEENGE